MTEAEFDRRLRQLVERGIPLDGLADLQGFADIFNSIKNVVVKAGSALGTVASKVASGVSSGASTLFKGLASGAGNVASALTGPLGQTLVSTAGSIAITNQAAKIEANKIALQTALLNQGYAATSPDALSLLRDVAQTGIVGPDGRYIVPGVQRASGGLFGGGNMTPVIIGVAGLLGLVLLTRSRSN